MKFLAYPIIIVAALAFVTVQAATASAAQLSPVDEQFVTTAQRDAFGQYALAALAEKKATGDRTRSLAKEVANNASSVNAYLTGFAAQHGVALENASNLRANYQYSNLASLSGSAFDQQFLSSLHIDTSFATDAYQSYEKNGRDPALRAFAARQAAKLDTIANSSGT